MSTTTAPPLPCLKEFKWIGHADTVCHALWDRETSIYMPWVAYGYDHPHSFEFIGKKQLAELKTTEQEIAAKALATLRTKPAKWEPVDVPANGKTLRILTCSGDFFSAEHVLDPAFMQEAQRRLKAIGLLVGVPCRGLLMATAATNDAELIMGFGGAVAGQFSRGESALISPMLFAMKDGAIVGILDDVAKIVAPDGEPKGAPGGDDEDEEADEQAPFISAMVSRNKQGTEDVHLLAGGVDAMRLAKGIEAGFMALLKEHAPRQEFSGHIEIVVLGMTPPDARKQIPSVLEHLRGLCNEMSRGKERRYRVSLTYQKDSLTSTSDAPPSQAPKRRAAVAEPPRRRVFTPQRVVVMILGAIAGIYGLYRADTLPSFPAAIAYDGASLTQATKWERERTAAAVYVPPGETMPSASLQLGIISSRQHATAEELLGWIRMQSQASPTQRYHDAVSGNERCLAGMGGDRPFLALQLCKSGKELAACIESDRELDGRTLGSCLNQASCFADLCDRKWSEERDGMDRILTSFLTP